VPLTAGAVTAPRECACAVSKGPWPYVHWMNISAARSTACGAQQFHNNDPSSVHNAALRW
jgi:hypothetical protein